MFEVIARLSRVLPLATWDGLLSHIASDSSLLDSLGDLLVDKRTFAQRCSTTSLDGIDDPFRLWPTALTSLGLAVVKYSLAHVRTNSRVGIYRLGGTLARRAWQWSCIAA